MIASIVVPVAAPVSLSSDAAVDTAAEARIDQQLEYISAALFASG